MAGSRHPRGRGDHIFDGRDAPYTGRPAPRCPLVAVQRASRCRPDTDRKFSFTTPSRPRARNERYYEGLNKRDTFSEKGMRIDEPSSSALPEMFFTFSRVLFAYR